MTRGAPRRGITRPCTQCGKAFYSPPSQADRPTCSLACRDARKIAIKYNAVDGTQRCARCSKWKPLDDFVKAKSPSGGHAYCKPCSSVWFHERRGTPIEKRKLYAPALTLPAEEKARRKRIAQKAYREANREKVRMWNKLRQHRQRACGVMPHRFDIGRMYCMQDARCTYCETILMKFHIDHKTPVSRGGSNDIGNLQLLCPRCNIAKRTQTHEEYAAIIERERTHG